MANATEVATQPTATNGLTTPVENDAKGGVHSNRRRIIKAASPKATAGLNETGVNGVGFAYQKNRVDDNTDEKKKKKHESVAIVDDSREAVESWRAERSKAQEKRSKSAREKELAERRKQPANLTANASANPFSRFISAFSVGPEHPEHKRHFETTTTDDEDLKGPDEKRLKASDATEANTEGARSSNDKPASLFSSKAFWATTAVVVVVGVALAVQRGRKK